MKPLMIFSNYWRFSRRYAQFEKLFELSQDIFSKDQELSEDSRKAIALLNKYRIDAQIKIGELDLPSLVKCAECKPKCCNNNADKYFSAIDYCLVRTTSKKELNYSVSTISPWYYYALKRFKKLIPSSINNKTKATSKSRGCKYLGKYGCKLDHSDRPIKCLVATCSKLRKSLDNTTRIEYIKLIDQLFIISLKVFDILKKEAGLPGRYGRLSLALTP